ncbi:predicted protein [Verticillium alfalfae VaMs.102]|uniref:Predicted protein n=1 Tax=Verticillium alfalfae (strain VaMs.102 / ATCC MYA-4576 / FGSC 10136) TaxID=526221 RepID=C9SAR4_VERA1|nr:predicted protein [Verticillium alfalfae VaMs.102]EEY16353.1 predicted protein [Verticillium alfalfae VaMs.102]
MPMPIFLLVGHRGKKAGATHDDCFPQQTRHSQSLLATSTSSAVKLLGASRTLSDNVTWHHLATEITWPWTALYLDLGSVEKRRFKCHDESCHSMRRTRWRWRQEPCAMFVRDRAASRIGDSHGDSIVSRKRSLVTIIVPLGTTCTTVVLSAFEPPRDGNSEGPCKVRDPVDLTGYSRQILVPRSGYFHKCVRQHSRNTICDNFGLDSKWYFWHPKPPVAASPGFVLGLVRLIEVVRPILGGPPDILVPSATR